MKKGTLIAVAAMHCLNPLMEELLRAAGRIDLLAQRLGPAGNRGQQILNTGGFSVLGEVEEFHHVWKAICSTFGDDCKIPLENFACSAVLPHLPSGDGAQDGAVFGGWNPGQEREYGLWNGRFQPQTMHIAIDCHLAQRD